MTYSVTFDAWQLATYASNDVYLLDCAGPEKSQITYPNSVNLLHLHVDGALLAVCIFINNTIYLAQQNLKPKPFNYVVTEDFDMGKKFWDKSPLVVERLGVRPTNGVCRTLEHLLQRLNEFQSSFQIDDVCDLRLRSLDAFLNTFKTTVRCM